MQNDNENLIRRLAETEEIIRALRGGEIDAVIGDRSVLLVRLKEVEDILRQQHEALEQMYDERTELVRELRQNQVELELQARDLSMAQETSEEHRQKYEDLYDYAPAGYLTLDGDGVITDANRTIAWMLAEDRDKLLGARFYRYVAAESQDAWFLYVGQLTAFQGQDKPELTMKRSDNSTFWALLDGSAVSAVDEISIRLVLTDITERKKAEDELRRYQEHLEELVYERTGELRELARRLVDSREQAQTTIGNELHDEVGQLLTYTTLLLDRALRKPDQKLVEEARGIVGQVISQIRDMSTMLSPRLLRTAGFREALYSLIEDFRNRTRKKVEFACPAECGNVPEEAALAVYRIIQESLTNITRHAKATQTSIAITKCDHEVQLEVIDNGVGFDPNRSHSHGLDGMKERAMAMGGECIITSSPGKGTRINARIPLENP